MSRKDQLILPASSPQTFDQRIRWWSCENTTDEDIPPFALMQLKKPLDLKTAWQLNLEEDPETCQLSDAGEVVWYVSKCDDEAAERQEPAQFVFNGPTPIPRRRPNVNSRLFRGRCHQEYPAQVLGATFDSWQTCGPRSGNWHLNSGVTRSAFVKISRDAANPTSGGTLNTIWVRPGRVDLTTMSQHTITGMGPDTYMPLVNSAFAPKFPDPTAMTPGYQVVGGGQVGVDVPLTGTYAFGFNCSLRGNDAAIPNGATLIIALYKQLDDDMDEHFTGHSVIRREDQEIDQYGNVLYQSQENVAMTGLIGMLAGESVALKNVSAYAIIVSRANFWLRRVSGYDAELDPTAVS